MSGGQARREEVAHRATPRPGGRGCDMAGLGQFHNCLHGHDKCEAELDHDHVLLGKCKSRALFETVRYMCLDKGEPCLPPMTKIKVVCFVECLAT